LCDALRETGYRFCRVAYRPLHVRLAEYLLGRRIDAPQRPAGIRGVTCVRLNTPCGFQERSVRMLERCAERGGFVVVYGHPHSLRSGNSQDVSQLVPFLEVVQRLRRAGRIQTRLPRQVLES
jgi:hypothetical protein